MGILNKAKSRIQSMLNRTNVSQRSKNQPTRRP
jgi:hypothetical protein